MSRKRNKFFPDRLLLTVFRGMNIIIPNSNMEKSDKRSGE